ncbi:MAG TPA: GNAT family N-acetyltransferase [Ottowia sp.]|nr:GNAT family N-acetyltransferase [Ottowia sp.]
MQAGDGAGAYRNAADGVAGGRLAPQIVDTPAQLPVARWNALLARQATPTPFMRAEYLAALHDSGSAVPPTGWTPRFMLLWDGDQLAAACPLYLKTHSYGEYVFDWAWANAYAEHGLAYYPKALVAVPFTPVSGTRLLARDEAARRALITAVRDWCAGHRLSSLHLLYGDAADLAACDAAGLMRRGQVQFHWTNRDPASGRPFVDFDALLAALTQDKRKKIRQERRKVAEAGVRFRWAAGADISPADWALFYRCYRRTYLEHGNAPYLTPDFFARMARELADAWVLFVAERDGHPIATSLIAVGAHQSGAGGQNASHPETVAYGRYWGALERVDGLHFEACYHQPLDWCIRHGVARFEGGAQGEHKMARALLPVATHSAHWLAHPGFADAVARFLARESAGVDGYLEQLDGRSPFRRPDA